MAERPITQAILKLVKSGDFTVYFITGHGEKATDQFDDLGLSSIAQVLTEQYDIGVGALNLLEAGEVPEDASALVIAGATSHFEPEEIDTLSAYMDRGGRLMVLADPPTTPGEENALDENDPLTAYLLEAFGAEFLENIVVSQVSYIQAFNPISDRVDGSHPTTQRLQQRPTVFFQARSLQVEAPPPGVLNINLIFTANDDYGETDIDNWLQNVYEYDEAVDTPGPLTMAMAVQRDIGTENEARLVLVGDSEFIVNAVWDLQGNPYFFTDSIDWLIDYTAEITVEAVSDLTQLPVFATVQQQNTIAFVTILVMPFSVLALGVVVWWSRRRR
ncbi:MAG: GldG family protein [Anaerolineae bacterium]|nr:GldG family protein [Anaerolineae bacterium]